MSHLFDVPMLQMHLPMITGEEDERVVSSRAGVQSVQYRSHHCICFGSLTVPGSSKAPLFSQDQL